MVDCIFCAIVSGQIQSFKVYEDENILCVLDIYPANPAHVLIFPKQHIPTYTQLPDKIIGKMFVLSKYIAEVIQKTLSAKGFNIYLASGEIAGQRVPHVVLHLIPRYDNDNINFEWERKQVDPNTLSQIHNAIYTNLRRIQNNVNTSPMQPNVSVTTQNTPPKAIQQVPNQNVKKKEKKDENIYEKMLYWFRRKR